MKLIVCTACNEIYRLRTGEWRSCKCGQTGGRYLDDGLHAEYYGEGYMFGISNPSFLRALEDEKDDRESGTHKIGGHEFDAWVIPWDSPRIKKVEKPAASEASPPDKPAALAGD